MRLFPSLVFPSLVAFALLALPCFGQTDFWIDPVLGSNQAAGSEAAPFRTITKGLDVAAPGATIHLKPGTYAASGGEVFPLRIGSDVSVVSVEGKASTTIHGDAGAPAGQLSWLSSGARLSGVTLTSSGSPTVGGPSSSSAVRSLVSDCDFIGGEEAIASGYMDVESCRFLQQTRCAVEFYRGDLRMRDCEIVGTPISWGVRGVYFYYDSVYASLEMTRCTITGCGRGGIFILNSVSPSFTTIRVSDSLIASNGLTGILLDGAQNWLSGSILVDGCTIANNGNQGVTDQTQDPQSITIRSSIVSGHVTADVRAGATVETSLVADGSGGSGPGVLTGDPRFVDPALGDWTLRFDSPCLDRGDATAVRLDRAGRVRAVDSDLDLTAWPDMGAFEHATLIGSEIAAVGQTFDLGVTGPSGGFSTIIVAPGGFAPFGASTIYGRLFLEPQGSFRLVPVLTTGGGPTVVDVTSVIDPAWVGTTIGFQALPRSFAAPAGGAFSNPLLVQVN